MGKTLSPIPALDGEVVHRYVPLADRYLITGRVHRPVPCLTSGNTKSQEYENKDRYITWTWTTSTYVLLEYPICDDPENQLVLTLTTRLVHSNFEWKVCVFYYHLWNTVRSILVGHKENPSLCSEGLHILMIFKGSNISPSLRILSSLDSTI